MKKINIQTFKHTLKRIQEISPNRKFCFILGAGASYNSGIPTGAHLAKKWFKEILEIYPKTEVQDWMRKEHINENNLASSYGPIYRKCFQTDKALGYEFLISIMKDAQPTFGHIVLAQILTKSPGHCVLTTNFDSLIETAIYQFTDKTPLVCDHESLSGHAKPSTIHPLIVKIHRDLLLEPYSDPDEINKLAKGWKEPLDKIFSSHIPIVIGYGGNDGSLMTYFEKMNKPSNFFWCELKGRNVSTRVEQLLEQMEGSLIAINGFDEIMHELLWVFDAVGPINEELQKRNQENKQENSSIAINKIEKQNLKNAHFKVAVSFPGEKREYVEETVNELAKFIGSENIFYDKWYDPQLARTEIDVILQNIYNESTDLVVVFLCKKYNEKNWCGIEWRAIKDLINTKKGEKVMLLTFDYEKIDGLYTSIDGMLDLRKRTEKQVAEAVNERLSFM